MWTAYLLGRNESGIWLYTPTGTPIHNAQGEQIGTLPAQAQLVPHDKPWVAAWCEDGSTIAHITTPPEVNGLSIHYLNLGLSCWVDQNGAIGQELDGYDRAVAAGLVPTEQDLAARSAFSDLQDQLAKRVEPFGQVGRRWFTGIKRNELHFVDYNPEWPMRFAAARDEMLPVLPAGSRVEHMGSTAVPGLPAKDCIDIAVVVPSEEQFDQAIDALESLGYERRPGDDDPGHVFLRRLTDGRRTHHLHLYNEGHPNLIEVLAFRDLLRADPQAREQYQSVKRSLAEANPYDRSGYLAGKNAVVSELLKLALTRQQQTADPSDPPQTTALRHTNER